MGINLLPKQYRPKPRFTWKSFFRLLVLGFVITLVIVSLHQYLVYRAALINKAAYLRESIANAQEITTRVTEYNSSFHQAEQLIAFAEQAGKSKQVWSKILSDIIGSAGVDVQVLEISRSEQQVMIKGESISYDAVGNYAVSLERLPWFANLEIIDVSSIPAAVSPQSSLTRSEMVKFQLQANLK